MKTQSCAIGLTVLLASVTLAATPLDSRFGVNPASYDVYSKLAISCQGKGSIPISKVNDDYCDCPEKGEDEPGTSACSNGVFFCKNIGSRAVEIGSWKVNDGICDCCDGSDEYLGFVNCPDTCKEEGRAIKEHLEALAKTLKQGLEQKQNLIHAGDSLKRNQLKRLEEVQLQIEAQKAEVETRRKKSIEADEAEKDEISHRSPSVADTNSDSSESSAQEKQDEGQNVKGHDSQDAHAEQSSFPYPEQYAFTGESSQPEAPSSENFPYPEQYAAPQKGNDNTERGNEQQEQPHSSEEEQDSEQKAESEHAEPESLTVKGMLGDLIAKIPRFLVNFFLGPSKSRTDGMLAREAREALKEAEDELETMKKELQDIKAFLQIDYGPSNAYRTLQSECFTSTYEKYTYKLCPFKEVSQIESHATSLGKFQQWNEDYTEWLFDHGQKCWNGPERSIKVKLICGLQNQIVSVHEPSTCVYEMQFETPAACSQKEADMLKSKLGELTQPEHFRDEL